MSIAVWAAGGCEPCSHSNGLRTAPRSVRRADSVPPAFRSLACRSERPRGSWVGRARRWPRGITRYGPDQTRRHQAGWAADSSLGGLHRRATAQQLEELITGLVHKQLRHSNHSIWKGRCLDRMNPPCATPLPTRPGRCNGATGTSGSTSTTRWLHRQASITSWTRSTATPPASSGADRGLRG
jgi:hypothetical protein